jgi:hypothetical protein
MQNTSLHICPQNTVPSIRKLELLKHLIFLKQAPKSHLLLTNSSFTAPFVSESYYHQYETQRKSKM